MFPFFRSFSPEPLAQLAGPMWSAPIQNSEFIGKVLEHLEETPDKYGTVTRMKGMLTVAKEELENPFYFTPTRISGTFHCECPSLGDVAYASLLSLYRVHVANSISFQLRVTQFRLQSLAIARLSRLPQDDSNEEGRSQSFSELDQDPSCEDGQAFSGFSGSGPLV
jgi:tRNA (guanine26-N2/guanine27-N2)-dimethyltransferase